MRKCYPSSQSRQVVVTLTLLAATVALGCRAHLAAGSGVAGLSTEPRSPADIAKLGAERAAWLNGVTYANLEDMPITPAPGNEIVTFVIELPLNPKEVGHTAMAVGNDFYDFGPRNGYQKVSIGTDWSRLETPYAFAEGAGWWTNPTHWNDPLAQSDIDYQMILDNLPDLATRYTTLLIPMEVTQAHAHNIRFWWSHFFTNPPQYTIPGLHCTSTVIKAFEMSDPDYKTSTLSRLTGGGTVWFPEVSSPSMYAKDILGGGSVSWNKLLKYVHRAGPLKGQPLKAVVGVVGVELAKTSLRTPAPLEKIKALIKAGRDSANPKDSAPERGAAGSGRDSRDAQPSNPQPDDAGTPARGDGAPDRGSR